MDMFELRALTFFYPEHTEPALEKVSLTVPKGAFLVLCGPSGCGKTTLLRQLKTALAPHGHREGEVLFEGRPLDERDRREQTQRIGFLQQSPENQIVTDQVWHELAFGLESLGFDTPTIRRRVAEMASFFGVQNWFHKKVSALSGGQKQLLNLASVMAPQPEVLLLDEPTSRLDPIAASDFFSVLGKINRELGVTVVLTEHRLEEALPLATAVAVLDGGRLVHAGPPKEVGRALKERGHAMFPAMPAPLQIWGAVESDGPCPLTVGEGRDWLAGYAARHPLGPLPPETGGGAEGEETLSCREVWFRYEREGPELVRGLSLSAHRGEVLALLGGNGTGKTTSLKLMAGLLKPQRGQVERRGRVGLLPQDPQGLFMKKTVREELEDALPPGGTPEALGGMAGRCALNGLLERHPYDLSGGEQQRLALAKLLLREPDILLLDEPTRSLDGAFKARLGDFLTDLARRGLTILMVSHDAAFCARYAHRCALFFDGSVVSQGTPRAFFSGNGFYTTPANRMARELLPQAVTPEDVIAACGGRLPEPASLPEETVPLPPRPQAEGEGPLPQWRKGLALLLGGGLVAMLLHFLRVIDLTALAPFALLDRLAGRHIALYGLFLLLLLLFLLCVVRPRRSRPPCRTPLERRRLSRRTRLSAALALLLVPLTLFVGTRWGAGERYYFLALLVLLECMAPFFLIFEGRRPRARELVIIAVLCAIGVAGRAAFFMLPQMKPVLALVVITGAALGGETGFLVGAVTMLVSNMFYAQGPWTPWQMFAMGLVGFLAGLVFRRGWLRRSRVNLCVFGALAAIVIYGGIMNPASALTWMTEVSWRALLPYYLAGFPMDCVHAAATWIFLWFAAEPMLEKLERIQVKYGLAE